MILYVKPNSLRRFTMHDDDSAETELMEKIAKEIEKMLSKYNNGRDWSIHITKIGNLERKIFRK